MDGQSLGHLLSPPSPPEAEPRKDRAEQGRGAGVCEEGEDHPEAREKHETLVISLAAQSTNSDKLKLGF